MSEHPVGRDPRPHEPEYREPGEEYDPSIEEHRGGATRPIPIFPEPKLPGPERFQPNIPEHYRLPTDGDRASVSRHESLQEILSQASEQSATEAQRITDLQPLLRKQSVALEWALFREGSTHPNAFTIQPEGLLQYMNRHDPAQGNYAIVDLRNPYDGGDFTAGEVRHHIKGAVHAPVHNADKSLILAFPFGDPMGPPESDPRRRDAQARWNVLRTRAPWNTLADKDTVFFHCTLSKDRTPRIATGYLLYGRENPNQKVVLIEGGWHATERVPGLTETIPEGTVFPQLIGGAELI